MTAPLTTVFVRQGKYAATRRSRNWPGAGLTVDSIGDVRAIDAGTFVAAGRGTVEST